MQRKQKYQNRKVNVLQKTGIIDRKRNQREQVLKSIRIEFAAFYQKTSINEKKKNKKN